MTDRIHTRVLIIGSGPAGYTAAVYAARAMLEPVLIQGLQPGGQLTITTDVENWPAEISIMGPDLMTKMEAQARHAGARLVTDHIASVDLSKRPYTAIGDSGAIYTGDTLIIATGAQARWLGLPSEAKFRGYGVSACATCDGFFFRNKRVAVIGGGNAAVEEALFLTKFASKVYLVHRRDSLRAEKVLQARLFGNPRIVPVWNAEVEEVLGSEQPLGVTGLRLRDTANGTTRTLEVDGMFVAIGHDPASQLFKGQIDIDERGYVIVEPGTFKTSRDGCFAVGDISDPEWRQAVVAAGAGCVAALGAERFLAHEQAISTFAEAAE